MQDTTLIRRSAKTTDGVTLNFVETGNPSGPPILFIHGISQSWRSWERQLEDPSLRSRFRLIALDLRGHGDSQGGLPGPDSCDGGTAEESARLWAGDIAAIIASCGLSDVTLVGWSYGGVVALDYLSAGNGMEGVRKVVLVATSPVIRPPGAADGGADRVFSAPAIGAILRSLSPDQAADGLRDFSEICLADDTGRPPADDREVEAITSWSLSTAPEVRMSIIRRDFDYRKFLAELPAEQRKKITVITPLGDKTLQPSNTLAYWPSSGIAQMPVDKEGHLYFRRNPEDFCRRLMHLVG